MPILRLAIRSAILLTMLCQVELTSDANAVFQDSTVGPGTHLPLITKRVQEVNLVLSITDHRGHFVPTITPADIEIRDNDQPPQQITYFDTQTNVPLRLAIVVDTSDSVFPYLNIERDAAETFLHRILHPASDLALLIAFNQEVQILQEPTADSHRLFEAMQKLPIGGDTAIYDAVARGSQELANIKDIQPARRNLILITDGADNSSHIGSQDAAAIAQQTETTVYVLSVGDQPPDTKTIKSLCDATGGQYLRIEDKWGIKTAFSKIEKDLRSQYVIGYKPANTSPDGSFHRIDVLVPHSLRIRHRKGYFATALANRGPNQDLK